MFHHVPKALASLTLATVLAVPVSATVVTFGTPLVDPLTTYTESGYSVQRVVGNSWRITNLRGNPIASLSTGTTIPTVGDRVDVFLTGGGLFSFTQFDVSSLSTNDTIDFFGEVNSVVTEQLLGVGHNGFPFQSILTGFTGPVDRVRIVIATVGSDALLLDNLVLTAIPEPGAGAMVVFAGLAIAWAVQRRKPFSPRKIVPRS